MGVLKLVFDYSDQLITYFLFLFLADVFYQFASTITFETIVLEKDTFESMFNFRPDLNRYINGYKIVKRLIKLIF